jgi:hypothetical protein
MKYTYRVFEENKKINLYRHKRGLLGLFSDWEFAKTFKNYKKVDKYMRSIGYSPVDIWDM